MKIPRRIQRLTIIKSTTKTRGLPLQQAVILDDMGHLEFLDFESALLMLFNKRNLLHVEPINLHSVDEKRLFICSEYNEEQLSQYHDYLRAIISRHVELVSPSNFDGIRNGKIDAWWDYDNGVVFSFDKKFMRSRLLGHLHHSFTQLDQHNGDSNG